jgi:putative transposase
MFLSSQVKELVALDFFVVPTVTYKVLFVLLMLSHHRRRVAHVKVTAHPTAEWTAQPLVEEFPWDAAL